MRRIRALNGQERNGRGSLRHSFILSLSMTLALVLAGTFWLFWSTSGRLAQVYVERFALSQNRLEENRIRTLVERETVLSLKMADDPLVRAWMRDEGSPEKKDAAFVQFESYRRIFRDRTVFAATSGTNRYFVGLEGNPFLDPVRLDPASSQDRWFQETLQGEKPYWINVNYDALLDEVRVWINAPVWSEPAGKGATIGAVGTGMNLSTFLAALVDHPEGGLETIILNREGQILAHRDRDITEFNARVSKDQDRIDVFHLFPDPEDRKALEAVLAEVETIKEARLLPLEYDRERVTAAIGFIPELDWFNLVMVEGKRVINAATFFPLLAFVSLALLAFMGLVVLLVNRLVLAPLARLTRAAALVAGGNYELDLDVVRDYETGRLAQSFSEMAMKIKEYTRSLESMVAARTRELEESRGKIMDSIQYGKLIQASILPSETELAEELQAHALIMRPLDTVGGDFPFFRKLDGGFCAALVDCTGHGVPGAFMTMLASTLLNQLIDTHPDADPADILRRLHGQIQDSLRAQLDYEHLENGLDIALCRYRREQGRLDFCGAGLPLFIAHRGDIRVVQGDRIHLGFRKSSPKMDMRVHAIPFTREHTAYLISDGILDLPGGARGFGLGEKGLAGILQACQTAPVEQQGYMIERALDRYRNGLSARDDLCLFAFAPKTRSSQTNG